MPPQQINDGSVAPAGENATERASSSSFSSNILPPFQLRVTCYGSSSSKTPERYLAEAHSLGYILATRGHTCVNGAGSYGCMAAMNEGAAAGNGHIVGVIHEMFVIDGSDWQDAPVGAHQVFHGKNKKAGPTREIIVAGGNGLQERKRMLMDGADALVVLPGGPGTWDELWEVACARNLGLIDIPIVCVNVDGYYDAFYTMLQRAFDDGLIKNAPHDVVHFECTAAKAVRWIEDQTATKKKEEANRCTAARRQLRKRDSAFGGSFLMGPMEWMGFRGSESLVNGQLVGGMDGEHVSWLAVRWVSTFVAGVVVGVAVAMRAGGGKD